MKFLKSKLLGIPINNYLIAFLIIFFILFTGLAIAKHYTLRTALFDFGLEAQVIKNTADLKFFKSGVEVDNYLGDHFSPIPILISSIVYKILPHDVTILSLQVLLIILGLIGFYKLVNLKLKNNFALILTIVLALSPGIQGVLLFDYHPVVYAFPFLIWAIYFNEKNNYKFSLLLFLLACLVKEDVGVLVGLFGIITLLNKKWIGLIYIIIGFGITTLSIQYLIPAIRLGPSDTLLRYEYFGNSFSEIIKNMVFYPVNTFKFLFTPLKVIYFLKITFSTLFLPVLKFKEFIILFLPLFLINALSAETMQSGASVHYDILTTVSLFYILILSIEKLKTRRIKSVIIILITFILISYLPFSKYFKELNLIDFSKYSVYLEVNKIKELIPKNKTVSVTNDIGAHFSEYSNLQMFNRDWVNYKDKPNIIVIYRTTNNQEYLKVFEELQENKTLLYNSTNFKVYSL